MKRPKNRNAIVTTLTPKDVLDYLKDVADGETVPISSTRWGILALTALNQTIAFHPKVKREELIPTGFFQLTVHQVNLSGSKQLESFSVTERLFDFVASTIQWGPVRLPVPALREAMEMLITHVGLSGAEIAERFHNQATPDHTITLPHENE